MTSRPVTTTHDGEFKVQHEVANWFDCRDVGEIDSGRVRVLSN